MEREKIESQNILSVGYNAAKSVLEIEFLNGGIYQYDDVPAQVHEGLMRRGSHSEFFREHIRGQYVYRHVASAASRNMGRATASRRLLEKVHQAYLSAKRTFTDLDQDRLDRAFEEAKHLAGSRIFGAGIVPDIGVDQYGEFTFSHESSAGYIDIGVRGDGELSYHVRNDRNPKDSKYDDYKWKDYHIPPELIEAISALKRHLRPPEEQRHG